MKGEPTCPRCGGSLRAPGIWRSEWECAAHGAVLPWWPVPQPSPEVVRHVVRQARVPVWLPWPLLDGWLVTGVGYCGDERTGGRATALACSGPNPFGGPGELVLVAEEPGVGLGARFAGIAGPDPGDDIGAGPPHAKVEAAGHPTPLWAVTSAPEAAVYVGEAEALWLWLVLWPDTAGHLLAEQLHLTDVRTLGSEVEVLPFGARTPRLAAEGRG